MRLIDADALREDMQWAIDHGMYDKPYDYLAEIDDAPTVGEWIPVSERLPEIGQKVLVSTKRTAFTQVFKGIYSRPDVWHWEHNSIKVITAWMPLPEPYKGGE